MTIPASNSLAFQREHPSPYEMASAVTSGNFTPHRVTIQGPQSEWIRVLSSRLNDLMSLTPGWDGYQGVPVAGLCGIFAANILERLCVQGVSAPSLVPGSDGTIQIEWHENGYDIEIDVLDVNEAIATRYNVQSGVEEYFELENDFSIAAKWINELRPTQPVAAKA